MSDRDLRCWRVLDFKNQRGDNEIHEWVKRERCAELKARLNALVRHLEALDRPFTRADGIGLLRKTGPCHGQRFIELVIKTGNVQYRPIGWYGPAQREITLLFMAKEKGGDFEPRNTCVIARNNKQLIQTSPGSFTVGHDFS